MAGSTVQTDTYGEITRETLNNLRANAHSCIRCGMLADVDPMFHQNRYGHIPAYRADGITWEWDDTSYTWDAQ